MAEEGLAYIIQNTHYGSLEATLEDIKKLGDLDEQAKWFRDAIRSHCESNLFLLSNEDGTEKLVVSASNRVSEQEDGTTVYSDLSALKHHTVCFTQRKVIQSAEYDESDPSDTQTVASRVAAGLKRYLDEFFSKNSGSYAVIGSDHNLHFGYTSKTHNAESFYSGHWNSEWKFDFGTKRLTGGTTIAVHLYEEGNTFFEDRKEADPEDLEKPVSSPNELAEEILSAVMGMERKLVKRLDQHFEEEGTECLKTLRLALPITQSPIDWDVNLAMVVSQLAAVAPKK